MPGICERERSGYGIMDASVGATGDQPHPVAEGGGRFMKKTLFINACVRPESRTRMLAQHALDRMGGEITEVDLGKENIEPLRLERLELRNALQEKRDFSHEMFRYAKAFAEADEILIAAPFWDLAFPAILRNYIENICVQGLTFYYTEEGFPVSLCRAKKLVYVMTAGGPTEGMDFGFPYVDTLCRVFFGIKETACFKAEMLDVIGVDAEGALRKAAEEIDHSDFF